ncbi:MAG: heparinase II/III family protein, partial [Clostridia bacterium]|nr:heparinase II/III family protein [Clostridia bacterium]
MKLIKPSLISYLLILSLILTSVMPAFAQEINEENNEYNPEVYSEFPEIFDFDISDSYYETTLSLEEEEELLCTDERVAFFKNYLENSNDTEIQPEDDAVLLAGSEAPEIYRDVSHISDQEFFGEWDDVTETWKNVGRINYDYSPDLAEVEALVKTNSYAMAKDALLEYYQNRTSIPRADFDGNISWGSNILWMKDAFNYGESPLCITNITNATEEYQEYNVDLMGISKQGTFVLSSITKTQDMVEIASRESGYSPSLLVVKADGTQVTLYPNKDTYIRGYDDAEDYKNEIYGDSDKLYVKDSYYQTDDGTYKPYSSKSRRTYIGFDQSKIPSDAVNMFLTFYAKIVPEEGVEQVTEDNFEMVIFNAYNQSWEEVQSENNTFKPMTWANYRQAHYSWNGLPGGYDFKFPDNFPSEGYYNSTRFYDVVSLAKSTLITGSNPEYVKKSLEIVLDFINDTNGQIEVAGVPANRDQEQKHRITNTPSLIATYIEADILSGEALSAILKWLWEEMTYVHNGAGLLYEGATTIAQANNYAETNRGFWMCEATLTACAYLPEYADHDMWKALADERLYKVTNIIINDDGCYQEPTFAYPMSVLSDYIDLWNELERTGHETPDWYKDKVTAFSKYILNIAYPNHKPPEYGEGTPGTNTGVLTSYLDLVDDDNIRYVVTDGSEGEAPDYTTAYFEQLKLAACRTGWSADDSMLIMAAKNGGNHNHKDSLHMMFYSGNLDLLADTGMTSYDSNHPHFQWQRHTTRSHNTIEIDGIAQRGSDFLYDYSTDSNKWNGQSDLKLYTSEPVDRIVAWTDATLGFRHYRNVSYVKNHNFIIVSDMVSPSDDKEHTYTQNWHTSALYSSDPKIDNFTKTGRTNYYSRTNLIIAQANTDNVDLTLETGYSRDSGSPTKYFCYTRKEAGDIMYNTILCPVEVGNTVDISAKNIDTGVNPAVASAMDINLFKNDEDVLNVFYYNSFEETPSERSFGGYTTDSASVMIEQNVLKVPQYLSMYNGTKVQRDGEVVISSDIVLDDIEIQYDGTTAVITSKDENISAAKLIAMTPHKIDNVTVNGEKVDFVYADSKIYINSNESVDVSADGGYLFRL